MSVPAEFANEFAKFPTKLRNLVLAELAAGNSIAEIGGGRQITILIKLR